MSKFLFIILYVKQGTEQIVYKKALLDFAYFVNVLAIEFSFPSSLNFNLLSRIQGA